MRRLTRTKAILIAGGAVLAVAGLASGFTFTPVFGADEIRVEGARHLSDIEVISLAGIELGDNVFHLAAEAAEAGLLESPWISSATVERDLPATVVIHIQEREAVGVVDLDGPTAVAADGVLLSGTVGGLPEIVASVGELSEAARTQGAVALAAMAPVVRERVRAVLVQSDGALLIELGNGATVTYGLPGDDEAKATALRAVLQWGREQAVAIATIDVSAPTAPTVTLVSGQTVLP